MRIILLLSFLFLIGCTKTPPELRDLVPVAITVTDGGKPLPAVRVTLAKIETDNRIWSCGATTDPQGRAVVTSSLQSHVASGAAPGTYKVTLSGTVTLPPELQPTEAEGEAAIPESRLKDLRAKREAYLKEHRVIPAALESDKTTTLELTVEPGKSNALTVDVAKYRQ